MALLEAGHGIFAAKSRTTATLQGDVKTAWTDFICSDMAARAFNAGETPVAAGAGLQDGRPSSVSPADHGWRRGDRTAEAPRKLIMLAEITMRPALALDFRRPRPI
jgi:hypothetical protein